MELRNSVGYFGGKLADQRRKAMQYFLGEAIGDLAPPEIDGRSRAVSTDVRNTILSMLPQLVAKFVGGDAAVEFEPSKQDDEKKADDATQYINYLFMKQNNGYAVASTWILDSLLQKNGIIKAWWDNRAEEKREEYRGLTPVELAEIMEDPEVEPIEQKSYPDEEDAKARAQAVEQMTQQMQQAMQAAQQPGPQQQKAAMAVQQMQAQLQQIEAQPPAMLYDVAFKRTLKTGKITVENVPPEEFKISRKAKSIQTASFVAHTVPRTLSELRSMGYPGSIIDQIGTDDTEATMNAERLERLGVDDEMAYISDNDTSDESQRVVWVNECYIRCDRDGDGISELRKVVVAGNQILDDEEVDCAPFVDIRCVPLPHKFYGLSIADLAMESQKQKTQILRAQLDNMYLEVNGRYFAVEGQVNLDDLLTSRPGGIVRVKQPTAVGRLDQGKGDFAASNMLMEWSEMDLEQRSGWTRYSQGNDSKALNQTATGVQIITNKGDMRVDLIARNMAEGFRDLFLMMLKLTSQHQDKKTSIRVNGDWIDMDPREWRNQFDVSVNVGLGIGSKDEQIQKMFALADRQAQALAIGVARPDQIYNMWSDITKMTGSKNPDRYWNDPQKQPPPDKPDPEQMKMQAQMQIEQAKLQATMQGKQAEMQAHAQLEQMKANFAAQTAEAQRTYDAQLEQARMQMQAEVDNNRQRAEAEQHSLKISQEAQLAQLKMQQDDAAHQREMEFQRWKAELDASVKIETANISSKAKVDDPATQTATREIASAVTQPDFSPITDAAKQITEAAAAMSKPRKRTLIRGEDGRATGMIEE
ncbi:hypothetical protein J7E70_07860 [Variovorax paradoxus]|nr:hypothetical protein [Variovorax paradoxus]